MKKVIGLVILYILAFALIVAGVFCGLQLYKEVKAESYVNGSIDISNRFSQESFIYTSTSVVFYHDLYDDNVINIYLVGRTQHAKKAGIKWV